MKKSVTRTKLTLKSLFNVILVITISILLAVVATAQTTGARPDRGLTAGGAYTVSDIENINLQNGNVNLSIPLASLPPIAGGKLSWTVSAQYNSKLWNIKREEAVVDGIVGYKTYVGNIAELNNPSGAVTAGGWRVGGAYQIVFRDAREDFDYRIPTYSVDIHQEWHRLNDYTWKKAILITPDGAEHELRPSEPAAVYFGIDMPRDYLNFYYRETPDTRGVPMHYSTLDGTYLSAIINPTASVDPVGWTIFMPDGTQVIKYKDGVERVRDTNGNSIRIDGEGIHDEQSGRKIKITGNEQQIQVWYQTVGVDNWQHVDINFGTTTVEGKVYVVNSWNPNVRDETGSEGGTPCKKDQALPATSMSVVREIVFPVTEPGVSAKRFAFGYNSDASTTVTTAQELWNCGQPFESYTRNASFGAGSLSRIVTPSGAIVEYSYSNDGLHDYFGPFHYFAGEDDDFLAREVITTKKLTHDNGIVDQWSYDIPKAGFATSSAVTNPDGSKITELYYSTDPRFNQAMSGSDGVGLGGLVYRSVSPGKMVEKKWRLLSPSGQGIPGTGRPNTVLVTTNPVVTEEYTTLLDQDGTSLKTSAKTFDYDYNGNNTKVKEYDWVKSTDVQRGDYGLPTGVPSSAVLLRETNNLYHQSPSGYTSDFIYSKIAQTIDAPNILSAIKETRLGSSITHFTYDNQPFETAPTKGNVTELSNFDDKGDSNSSNDDWVKVFKTYDQYGNVATSTDANGNLTKYFYEDDTHALPTKVVVNPLNGTDEQVTQTTHDIATGLVTSTTDINGQKTEIDYTNRLLQAVDPFGRPGTIISPAITVEGLNQRRRTYTTYEDSLRRVTVESDLKAEGDKLSKSRTTSDQLGRPILAEQSENGSNYTVFTQTSYEQAGKVTFTSNPMRSTPASTDGWSRTITDDAGRVVEVAAFTGAIKPGASDDCLSTATCTGRVKKLYKGEFVTVTDQAGKVRRSRTDALGRIVRLDEPSDSSNTLGSYDAPTQPTAYVYDTLNNLTKVMQGGQLSGGQYIGGQRRTFTYSSISRLITATNPESGTFSYEYDSNGNLKKKIDPRLLTDNVSHLNISYDYDGLNRIKSRSYNDGTPNVRYFYDSQSLPAGAPVFNRGLSVGKLIAVIYGEGALGSYTGDFDGLGQPHSSLQATDTGLSEGVKTYRMSYEYNLSGSLKSETYPSGRVVANEYDQVGQAAGVKNQATGMYYVGAAPTDYINRIKYAANGAVTALKLGNGLWENSNFNSRNQTTAINLGATSGSSEKMQLIYNYGTTGNNGNLLSQRIVAPGFDATQSYEYDELNRLKVAQELKNSVVQWKQVYGYDRYGNRRFAAGTTFPDLSQNFNDPVTNPQIDPLTNKFFANQDANPNTNEYVYDNGGNVTTDALGRTFKFNANNLQTVFNGGSQTGGASYFYDGDNRRVRKVTVDGATIFVYDAAGNLVAEYSSETPLPGTGGTKYLTTDTLGSPRVISDQSGNIVSRHDYAPFGEELATGRTAEYKQDSVNQKFTGQERDKESGLDYFDARYYSNIQGRFTSIDPLAASGRATNPQTWNRYAYVLNNPMRFIDPTGMTECPANQTCPDEQQPESAPQESISQISYWDFDLWSEITVGEPAYDDGITSWHTFAYPTQHTTKVDLESGAEAIAQAYGLSMANDIYVAMVQVDSIETFSDVKRVDTKEQAGTFGYGGDQGVGVSGRAGLQVEHVTASSVMTALNTNLLTQTGRLVNELRPLSSPLAGYNGQQNLGTTMTSGGISYAASFTQTTKRVAYERAAREFKEVTGKNPSESFKKLF